MQLLRLTLFAIAALEASAKTTRVDVGQNGLTFSPNTITAAKGDILEFHFHPINHSVVMSDFSSPCTPAKSGGFFSGFMAVSSGEGSNVFQLTINDTNPIFFYCAQNIGSHCASGMSGAINPSGTQTLAAYQSAAKSVSAAVAPAAPFGGTVTSSGSGSGSASGPGTTSAGAAPTCTPGSGSGSGSGYKRATGTCGNGAGMLTAPLGGLLGLMGAVYLVL